MLDHGGLCGYMLGTYAENVFFGKHVWVPYGGFALDESHCHIQNFAQMYAAAGERWIQDRVLNHYLVCPAKKSWLDLAFKMSFGQEQAYAAASVKKLRLEQAPPKGISLREVDKGDAKQLFEKADWIASHLNRAPVWEPVPEEHLKIIRPAYAELAADPTSTTWVALDGDRIISYVVIYTVDQGPEHLLGDAKTAHFAAAATHPDYRGRGVGRSLFTHILNVAHQQGYQQILTDWRTTNLIAGKYWPTFGFEPYAYRLIRRVNPKYAPYLVD